MRKNDIEKIRKLKPGFTTIPNQIVRDKNLSSGAKIFWEMMYIDKDDFAPSDSDLMVKMGLSKRQLNRYRKELIKYGYYVRIPNDKGGYYITLIPQPEIINFNKMSDEIPNEI